MQGVPLDGYWLAFDEAQLMNREALSVVIDSVFSIFNAIRMSLEHVTVHGSEVSET
jgi:hypothetical protein